MSMRGMLRKPQKGFSLVEVLVSVFVMAIGVLGVLSMQLSSLSNNRGALYRSQATLMAMDIIDRMRSNPEAADDGLYHGISASYASTAHTVDTCTTSANGCSAAQMLANDVGEWQSLFADGVSPIPQATGAVVYDAANDLYTVTIQWSERGWDAANAVQADLNKSFTVSVRL